MSEVRQSREGDTTRPGGYSDIGAFGLTTRGLKSAWENYLETSARGKETREVNFLPFLVYLSRKAEWALSTFVVDDPQESRGINSAEDLRYFQNLYSPSGSNCEPPKSPLQ